MAGGVRGRRGMRGGDVCMAGDVCGVWGGGACVTGGMRAKGVNEQAICILLECILVILILLQIVNVKPHSH